MLPSKNRIGKHRKIERVKRQGIALHSKSFLIVFKDRNDPDVLHDEARFSFVLSTNVSKLAVHRVRINRALQEVVRRNIHEFPGKVDYVFIARPAIASLTSDEMINEARSFVSGFAKRMEKRRAFVERKKSNDKKPKIQSPNDQKI